MSEQLIDPKSQEAEAAPDYLKRRALQQNKHLLRIVWDKAGGYPSHAWGYIQWSIRPFNQRQGCDGTIDDNVHLIAWKLCEVLGLDYRTLYIKAYAHEPRCSHEWLTWATLSRYESETVVPELSEQSLKNLLYDLGDINNRSILAVLEDEFTKLGYDVSNWWED